MEVNKLATYLEITLGSDDVYYILNETHMMTSFDMNDYWQRRRYSELMPRYIRVIGKGQDYFIRGNIFYGLTNMEKLEFAKQWAVFHFRNYHKFPKWSLMD